MDIYIWEVKITNTRGIITNTKDITFELSLSSPRHEYFVKIFKYILIINAERG